jgi:hypothetical protein
MILAASASFLLQLPHFFFEHLLHPVLGHELGETH